MLFFRFGEGERDELLLLLLLLLLLELDDDEDDDEDDEDDDEESESDPESEEEDEDEEEELLELLDEDEGLPRRRFFEPFFCAGSVRALPGRKSRKEGCPFQFPWLTGMWHTLSTTVSALARSPQNICKRSVPRPRGITFGAFLVCHDGLGRAARERKLEPPQSGGSIGTGSRLRSVSPDIARGGRVKGWGLGVGVWGVGCGVWGSWVWRCT